MHLTFIQSLTLFISGKTVLSSLVVEECQSRASSASVAFFYCRHRNLQECTFIAVAREILAQLLQQNDDLVPYFYEKASHSGQPLLDCYTLATELLKTVFSTLKRVFIIIDGLDEFGKEESAKIILWFQSTINPSGFDNGYIRLLFISQDNQNTGRFLSNYPSIHIKAKDNRKDIQCFVSGFSIKLQLKFELSDALWEDISSAVVAQAQGTIPLGSNVATANGRPYCRHVRLREGDDGRT
jgi:hypothetical protein